GFLRVGTTLDIFQNVILIPYLEYGILILSGYGVLIFIPLWSLYLQGGILTMTYTTSTTKSKASQYDLPGIEDMVPNIWSPVKVVYDRYALWEDLQLGVESYQKKINVTKPDTTRPNLRKRHPYTPYKDPQGFIDVDDFERKRLMRFDELYKFSDGTLTILLSSLENITKNIDMEYLPKRT
ncbi:hypothetical protein Tco_0643678, partial [Tanacetum coccineum]